MPGAFRRWIHRHFNVVLAFVIGLTFGISVLALAYFSTMNDAAAEALQYGARITRHPDVGEDMGWFFSGIVVGASVTCLAWWRDGRAQSAGLEEADVLNRLFRDPAPRPAPQRWPGGGVAVDEPAAGDSAIQPPPNAL